MEHITSFHHTTNNISHHLFFLLVIVYMSMFVSAHLHAMEYPELAELENLAPQEKPYHGALPPSTMIPPLYPGLLAIEPHNASPHQHLHPNGRLVVLDERTLTALLTVIIRHELQQQHYVQEHPIDQQDILFRFRDYPVLGLISLAYENYPQLTLAVLALATGTALWNYDKIIELYKKTREKVMKALLPKKSTKTRPRRTIIHYS